VFDRLSWAVLLVLSGLLLGAGCGGGPEPRMRFGCYPTRTIGTNFPDPNDLGKHGYRYSPSEKIGIVYTCKAGHIDLAHLRIAADWTAYLTELAFECLRNNQAGFSFKAKPAPSRYFVSIDYPQGWKNRPVEDREKVAREVSLEIGQYLAFTATTWHEILTWFGYKFTGFLSEFASAFSWEDSFSNLLGTRIAAAALRDDKDDFDQAVTREIYRELESLGVRSRKIAKQASEKVRGQWYSGRIVYFVNIRKRNLDIGLDDGYVTATLVPGIEGCEGAAAQSYPVPRLELARRNGFAVKVEIEPRVWEQKKIFRVLFPHGASRKKKVVPAVHFARIMEYINRLPPPTILAKPHWYGLLKAGQC